jgi:hypothetical protein
VKGLDKLSTKKTIRSSSPPPEEPTVLQFNKQSLLHQPRPPLSKRSKIKSNNSRTNSTDNERYSPPPHRLLSPCHSCLLSLPLTSQRISNPIPRKPHDRNGPNWKLLKTRSREFLDILDPLCLSSTRHERCDLNSTFQSNSKICSQPQLNVSLTLPLPPLNTSNISLSLPPTRRTRHLQRVPPLLHSLHLSLRDQHPHH